MKNYLLLPFILPIFIFSQQFADKSYYLIDNLDLNELSEHDKTLINKSLREYHESKIDTIKVKSISLIIDGANDKNLWPKYNFWLNKVCEKKLKVLPNSFFYKNKYAETLNNIGAYFNDKGEIEKAINYYNQALIRYKELDDNNGIAMSLNNIAVTYNNQGNIGKALDFYKKALTTYKELKNKKGIGTSLNNIAHTYSELEDLTKALVYYNAALKIYKELNDQKGIGTSLNNIAFTYWELEDLTKALVYYKTALKTYKEIEDKKGITTTLNNLGFSHLYKGEVDKALEYYNQALTIGNELNNKEGIAESTNNIGHVFEKKGEIKKALKNYNQALKIYKELENKKGTVISLSNIGYTYYNLGDLENSKNSYSTGLKITQELGNLKKTSSLSKALSKIALNQKKYKEAFEMYTLHIKMRDSAYNIEARKNNIRQTTKYTYAKQKEIDDLKNQKELELEEEKNKSQSVIILFVISIIFLFIIFLFFAYRRLQISKKQNIIIEEQKKEVETKQKALQKVSNEINDSINYAVLIQNAVLPTLKLKELYNKAFIYFNPKGRVSGDFFWLEQKKQYSGYCVADCTGHGIPGAFIAMIGTILMNEIHNSKQINIPNKILSELSRLIELTLTDRNGNKMKDGMDMSFVLLNNEHKTLYFSGANNPVWIASNEAQKSIDKKIIDPIFEYNGKYLYEIKGDKQPVGFCSSTSKTFTLHRADLTEGDTFYLFSDGYVDQFGGTKNKKFKAKAFRELLLLINDQDMDSQKNILSERFESWKGENEQIDDVTIMGVRV